MSFIPAVVKQMLTRMDLFMYVFIEGQGQGQKVKYKYT